MILERIAMKIFARNRLAIRDERWVYEAIDSSPKRMITGYGIGIDTLIPTRDLVRMLARMEDAKLIERDPGPYDQPYTRSVMGSWWCPGAGWPVLAERYGDES